MTPFDRLKKLADKQGLSVNAVETKIGLGTNTLYSWKKKIPSGQNLTKVADYFNVSTDYLLGRTDNPEIAGKKMHTNAMAAHYAEGTRQLTKEQIQQLDEMTNALIAGFKAQNKKDDE
ncbi:helix-turn-helix domain-containing protein [Lapidilactobacillus wuchangensis]|uniref:helix-turn-helix domain-containing protein n=1 Tax=Lapidilactobacillus wuchangensis TaxID=2486001 RepID=UPI000F7A832A|nr:helix-turn-helix transcriptional regulator [Lapidilactobacillus wuchangensis]